MSDFEIVLVQTPQEMAAYFQSLPSFDRLALDIEMANWWNPQEEQIALIQLAHRRPTGEVEACLIDIQQVGTITPLKSILEDPNLTIVIHNAGFDAVKLHKHFHIRSAGIYDTMRAARRGGAKKYSLAALIKDHFGIELDKTEQRSDWSRRPFSTSQLNYAARDAVYTLLLSERQMAIGLSGHYELTYQSALTLFTEEASIDQPISSVSPALSHQSSKPALERLALAVLGIVVKKPNYYSPETLVVALTQNRIGLTGWIVSLLLGDEIEIDEDQVRLSISQNVGNGLIQLDDFGRFQSTALGEKQWAVQKPPQIPGS